MLTFDQLTLLLRPNPPMARGFAACVYEFRVLTLEQALASLTCWDKVSTITEYAKQQEPSAKTAAFVDNFPAGPVLAIVFTLDTLARIWPEQYGGRSGSQLVVWDGNNRLSALARRRIAGVNDAILVGAFVGV